MSKSVLTAPVTLRAGLRALGHNCRLAKAASDALTEGVVTKPQGRLHTYFFFPDQSAATCFCH